MASVWLRQLIGTSDRVTDELEAVTARAEHDSLVLLIWLNF
jgi:hypothetical protein